VSNQCLLGVGSLKPDNRPENKRDKRDKRGKGVFPSSIVSWDRLTL
jgi:hypothetical protein